MIVGIGVDIVDVPRFTRSLSRTPRLLPRLFSPAERVLKPRSLAARYAAKEALIKALGGSDGVHWTEIEVTSEPGGRPVFTLTGSTARVLVERGITALHLSMSHDAGLATAYVVAEAGDSPRFADAGGAASTIAVDSPRFGDAGGAASTDAGDSPRFGDAAEEGRA
jgi:holo-[acyl-carrier protein] synthase